MATIEVKAGVEPRIIWILAAISQTPSPVPVVITAGHDGVHKVGSKHYTYNAVDVRSHNFPSSQAKQEFLTLLKARLGPGYYSFLESPGTANEHFHIEWDRT